MGEKLVWKAFDTFEEMEDERAVWLASLTPERIQLRALYFKTVTETLLKNNKVHLPNFDFKLKNQAESDL